MSTQFRISNREGSPHINPVACAICGKYVPEERRVFEQRPTGPGLTLQVWTYCQQCGPRPKVGKVETSLQNRSTSEFF